MSTLTEEQTALLRQALGLTSENNDNPTKNRVDRTPQNKLTIHSLQRLRYLRMTSGCSMSDGRVTDYYYVTDAGKEAVLAQPW